jgi:signal transduction histidine kinase
VLGTDGKNSMAPSESTDQPPESAQSSLELTPDATPRSAQSRTSTDAPARWAYGWVDRRLKIMSVLLPVAFILGLEVLHYQIEARDRHLDAYWDGYHAVFVVVTVASILVFGMVMFRFIDRAQRQVVRQNHELAATNALSSAVQGEVGVDRIVDVALESLLATSGAVRASVTIFSGEDRSSDGADTTRQLLAVPGSALLVPDDPGGADAPIIDFPLSTGAVTVGHMRLWLPVGAGAGERLASGTLQNIGHQLASAIQLAQLFADLERKNHEGHAFHDILLQVSNQGLPADILGSVVRHARDLMSSDEAVLCLDEEASRSVQFAGTLGGPATFGDGPVCITSDDGLRSNVHGQDVTCPLRSSAEWKTGMAVPILGPMGKFGELWMGRRSEVPFTENDRAFLVALSGLAAIAIASVRMRESGRHRAVLAERERIAREMHDSLAQVLGVTHLRLRALDSRKEVRDNPVIEVELADLADLCEEAYRDVREAILGLSASNKSARGLLDVLSTYLVKYSRQCGIATSLESDLDHELSLSPRCEVQVIRVIQEALTNVRKHSGAKSAVVRITESASTTTFVVEDDGDGFDPGGSLTDRDGFGMFTMRERMVLLNGSLTVDSAPGRGTRVIAGVPERSHPRRTPVEVTSAGARTDPHPSG